MEQEQLLATINARLDSDELILPTLPDVALEINDKLLNPEVTIKEIVKLIKKDPAIAASIIRFANTALVKGTVPIQTIQQATVRIGLKKLRNLTLSFAVQQMFFAKDVSFAIDLYSTWKQASDTAVIACATLDLLHHNDIALDLNSDLIFLIALVHNIGFLPVLTEADRLGKEMSTDFRDAEFIQNASMSFGVQLTRKILEKWKFDEEVIKPAHLWSIKSHKTVSISYLDILRLSLSKSENIPKELRVSFIKEAIKKDIIKNKDWSNNIQFKESVSQYKSIFN
jgi:HD-like signal output (HDOD) protein